MSSPSLQMTNYPEQGREDHMTHFHFDARNHVSRIAEASRQILHTCRIY